MRCPFLREAQVKFCRASAFRKMIVRLPGIADNERCSSPAYVYCPTAKQYHEEHPSLDHCPFLHESLVQYCSAASVTKYIPYSELALSQCGNESHRYCELYLSMATGDNSPVRDSSEAVGDQDDEHTREYLVDGIRVPGWLWFSPHHMWLDISADGRLHVGIDELLARVLGSIDGLMFLTAKGVHRPTVALSVQGIDMQVAFPNSIMIAQPNCYLRSDPSRVIVDPYGLGWLFEGLERKPHQKGEPRERDGLISGKAAAEWMKTELNRISAMVHEVAAAPDSQGTVAMADGGWFQNGLFQHLRRGDILRVFNEFFSPFATWRSFE
jgi:glycine cleavage system H lipoate-binding protein